MRNQKITRSLVSTEGEEKHPIQAPWEQLAFQKWSWLFVSIIDQSLSNPIERIYDHWIAVQYICCITTSAESNR